MWAVAEHGVEGVEVAEEERHPDHQRRAEHQPADLEQPVPVPPVPQLVRDHRQQLVVHQPVLGGVMPGEELPVDDDHRGREHADEASILQPVDDVDGGGVEAEWGGHCADAVVEVRGDRGWDGGLLDAVFGDEVDVGLKFKFFGRCDFTTLPTPPLT